MIAVGESVKGLIRLNNEDSFYISGCNDKIKNLYIVADGMGGHKAGEIASKKAIEYFLEYINENINDCLNEEITDCLVGALAYCNEKIYQTSKSQNDFEGMGTTFTCGVIEKNKLIVVHVGDSRAYIFGANSYRQVTGDHSFVMEMVRLGRLTTEEASEHPKKNIITKAVGTEKSIEADVFVEELKEGDFILICSDGLTNMVQDSRIAEIIKENSKIEDSLKSLVDEANKNGGRDNISVVLIGFEVET